MADQRRPGWRGRAVAVAGIVLVALNLRVVVAAVSPILDTVRVDVPLTDAQAGLLGSLPVLAFALSGSLAPLIARRFGMEPTIAAAMAVSTVGEVLRSTSGSTTSFLGWTVVALLGMGIGNVLLPPLVKRYFPDRIPLVTLAYTVAMSFSTALPPLLAVPAAERYGWRWALGAWAVIGVAAVLPWAVIVVRSSVVRSQLRAVLRRAPQDTAALAGRHRGGGRVWRSSLARGMAVLFGLNSLNSYVVFAWLPQLYLDAGLAPTAAGQQLALYAIVGLPAALVMPPLAARLRNPYFLVVICVTAAGTGYGGMALAPAAAPALWTLLAGLGPATFPLMLTLVGLRSRTSAGAMALSGFMQGVGYVLAAAGPIVVGLLYGGGAGWGVVMVFLGVTLAGMAVAGVWACRPVLVEDTWHRRGPHGGPGTGPDVEPGERAPEV